MPFSDISLVFWWWLVLFLVGVIFLPLTTRIFSSFFDRGYIFSKIIGILLISYFVWILGSFKVLSLTELTIILTLLIFLILNLVFFVKVPPSIRWNLVGQPWKIFIFEELIFLTALFFWSYIRAHEPSIHGLEKYMDFGFINSILRTDYFPPKDLWMTPLSINYYYFGHLITAVLTKLSRIDSVITYNLMIATLFALTFSGAFSIGANLVNQFKIQNLKIIAGGLLIAFLVTFAGNLHTIYAFFKPYIPADNPVPFWQLEPLFGFSSYWYPNATRFIPFTIHEFPIYSFIVSDLHGHVLSIPIVLTIIAVLLSLIFNFPSGFTQGRQFSNFKFQIILLSFLIGVVYMTNVWDGIIYFTLMALVLFFLLRKFLWKYLILVVLVLIGSIILSLPFSLNFKPFASGIGVLCAPKFLTEIGSFGPFLFEPNHCQRSPFWQLAILYGFFYFFVIGFLIFLRKFKKNVSSVDVFILILTILSTLLIIIPEFIYIKDIYPAHYRANTMFKLVYQAFIMLSIASGYIIVRILTNVKRSYWKLVGLVFVGGIGLFLVAIYPFFAINSYYGNFKTYRGLDGLSYLRDLYPTDYEAVLWLRKNIKGQPVVLEAQGESYTDFARVSANTGLPTVIGWPVHEWLWRGSYDLAAPRISDVKMLYETADISIARQLINKYKISLIFIGDLERQKYPNLSELKFERLGKLIHQTGQTKIYQLIE